MRWQWHSKRMAGTFMRLVIGHDKAVAFAEKYGIGKVYSDYNEMFTDPEVDVIYITTPQYTH